MSPEITSFSGNVDWQKDVDVWYGEIDELTFALEAVRALLDQLPPSSTMKDVALDMVDTARLDDPLMPRSHFSLTQAQVDVLRSLHQGNIFHLVERIHELQKKIGGRPSSSQKAQAAYVHEMKDRP